MGLIPIITPEVPALGFFPLFPHQILTETGKAYSHHIGEEMKTRHSTKIKNYYLRPIVTSTFVLLKKKVGQRNVTIVNTFIEHSQC